MGLIPGVDRSKAASHSKAVIRISILRREAASMGCPRAFRPVSPRTAPRHPARAGRRTGRILQRAARVIIGVVPILAPLMDVVAHVEHSEVVRRPCGDRTG